MAARSPSHGSQCAPQPTWPTGARSGELWLPACPAAVMADWGLMKNYNSQHALRTNMVGNPGRTTAPIMPGGKQAPPGAREVALPPPRFACAQWAGSGGQAGGKKGRSGVWGGTAPS